MSNTNVVKISVSSLLESKFNPRSQYDDDKLAELAASMVSVGQQQAIKVRKDHGGSYEIVFGHRRFRAAKKAKLETLDAIVVDMTDEEVALAQIVENGQREDVTPLEEADSYEVMRAKFDKSVDDIAALIGKSKSHVYARLKLTALADAGRKALTAGKIVPETALLIARIPTEKLQTRAVRELTTEWRFAEGPSFRDAAEHIQRNFMLQLANAPFDTKSKTLVPDAGTCAACPKRTGNMPSELRTDVKGADICTDPECFASKLAAHAKQTVAAAKEEGLKVLSAAEAAEAFKHDSEYVDVATVNPNDPKRRSWEQILGKHLPPVTLAKDERNFVHRLCEESVLKKALKDIGYGKPTPTEEKESEEASKERAKEKEAKEIRKAALVAIIDAIGDRSDKVSEGVVYRLALYDQPWGVVENVSKHHSTDYKGWVKFVDALPLAKLKSILLECIVEAHATNYVREGVSKGFRETLAVMGLDLAKQVEVAKAALKEVEEAAEKAAAAAKAAKAKAKPAKKAKGPLARKAKGEKVKVSKVAKASFKEAEEAMARAEAKAAAKAKAKV